MIISDFSRENFILSSNISINYITLYFHVLLISRKQLSETSELFHLTKNHVRELRMEIKSWFSLNNNNDCNDRQPHLNAIAIDLVAAVSYLRAFIAPSILSWTSSGKILNYAAASECSRLRNCLYICRSLSTEVLLFPRLSTFLTFLRSWEENPGDSNSCYNRNLIRPLCLAVVPKIGLCLFVLISKKSKLCLHSHLNSSIVTNMRGND